MSLRTVGLILLLIGAGYFLNWGYPGANANVVFDSILGAIFAILGLSLVMYRSPLASTTEKFVRVANQIMDNPTALLSSVDAEEQIALIHAEARKAAREIKERAQMRVEKISKDVGRMAASGGE